MIQPKIPSCGDLSNRTKTPRWRTPQNQRPTYQRDPSFWSKLDALLEPVASQNLRKVIIPSVATIPARGMSLINYITVLINDWCVVFFLLIFIHVSVITTRLTIFDGFIIALVNYKSFVFDNNIKSLYDIIDDMLRISSRTYIFIHAISSLFVSLRIARRRVPNMRHISLHLEI